MPLTTITQQGALDATVLGQLNRNFAQTQPYVDYWVRPQASGAEQDGSWAKPFGSMALARPFMTPGVVIGLEGVLKEEFSAPIVNDLSFVGAKSNAPRQATTSGVPNGGGATWLSPSGGTGSLLTINGQSNLVSNIYFNNSATGATTAGVKLVGGGDPPLTADAGGTTIENCTFTGEANGIYIDGGPGFLRILGNTFYFFDSTGDCAILAGGSGGTGYGTRVIGNVFQANLTHIKGLSTGYGWLLTDNYFSYISAGVTTGVFLDFTGGNDVALYRNIYDVNSGNAGIANMFVLGTNPRSGANILSTAVTTTDFSWGDPA
jgi:hypothetical protein